MQTLFDVTFLCPKAGQGEADQTAPVDMETRKFFALGIQALAVLVREATPGATWRVLYRQVQESTQAPPPPAAARGGGKKDRKKKAKAGAETEAPATLPEAAQAQVRYLDELFPVFFKPHEPKRHGVKKTVYLVAPADGDTVVELWTGGAETGLREGDSIHYARPHWTLRRVVGEKAVTAVVPKLLSAGKKNKKLITLLTTGWVELKAKKK
jgi:hypothetical protein